MPGEQRLHWVTVMSDDFMNLGQDSVFLVPRLLGMLQFLDDLGDDDDDL